MLLVEVMVYGKWYPLQIKDEDVIEEIKNAFALKEDEELEGWMLHRKDCPRLHDWMSRLSYMQDVVSVSHYPEVMEKG